MVEKSPISDEYLYKSVKRGCGIESKSIQIRELPASLQGLQG